MIKKFRIFRYDPKDGKEPRFDDYDVECEKGMTVLEGLYYILQYLDSSIAFRFSCREAVCGSCAMHINGQYRLACKTQISGLKSNVVTIRPLSHLPVLKDLVVDMKPFFDNYRKIKPYLVSDNNPPEKEYLQSPKQRKKIDKVVDCILCAACYGSCPVASTNPKYLGPQALLTALRFINDSRDVATDERIALVANDEGIFRCHTIFNCQQVCPKGLDPTNTIIKLRIKSFFNKIINLFKKKTS